MAISGYPSLSGIASALGPLIGTEISLDVKQEQCLQEALRKEFNLFGQHSYQRYEVYPAVASSGALKAGADSVDRVYREGLVIRTEDTGEWYYIGGISPYWAADQLVVYQGGSKATSAGKLPARIISGYADRVGVGAVPLYRERIPSPWYNPIQFRECGGTLGILWNALSAYQLGFLAMLTNVPVIREYSERYPRLSYSSKDGHYYLSKEAENNVMRVASDTYPVVYEGVGPSPSSIKLGNLVQKIYFPFFTFNVMSREIASICQEVTLKSECTLASDYLKIDEANIGSPIVGSLACGNQCSQFGITGLVSKVQEIFLSGLQLVLISAVRPPVFTSTGIEAWAQELGIGDLLSTLLEGTRRFKRAITDLASLPFIAVAASTVDWIDQSYEQGLAQAKEKAEELQSLYNQVVQKLAGNPPPLSDRLLYEQWTLYKLKVENCARYIILDNPNIAYDELQTETQDCAGYPD
ncbi:hypothetical protein L3N51_01815 [Metallosphaera sp. J1]|uniref:hypothetical protein n=1 Tax=Metallosphaera javensis (ex Hofmann et al. 2022) TaxID=99938 RepID=UPI001EDF6C08|nr:hypothetical protein [Metallosphaera javensis (ex Hofmann et al. 2022)]MCG3109521.1 hypothetical protein [Metallosphaera javensis (ex Hofmann et al. 2022)]